MTIDFREVVEVENKQEFSNVQLVTGNYLDTIQNNISNMMRPMPFSGYPFQGNLLQLTKYY